MEMEWCDRLNRVLEYIEKNLSYGIDYDEISRIALCHANHVQQFFLLNTGITLTEYIRRRRISEAARELQNPDSQMTVTDIAFQYGYESPDAFRVAFKRYYNITPKEARRSETKLKPYPQFSFKITITYEEREDFMNDIKVFKDLLKAFEEKMELMDAAVTEAIKAVTPETAAIKSVDASKKILEASELANRLSSALVAVRDAKLIEPVEFETVRQKIFDNNHKIAELEFQIMDVSRRAMEADAAGLSYMPAK